MDRRGVLKSVMSTVGGVGLIAAGGAASVAEEQTSRVSPTKGRPVAFIDSSDSVGLFYRDWGTGSPLVFLAPWGMDSDWWEYQMSYLVGQGLRCIGYDRRGHGRSVEPSGGYDYDTLADDLNEVIERLDLHGVTLVGHSIGCGEVVRYLSRHGAGRMLGQRLGLLRQGLDLRLHEFSMQPQDLLAILGPQQLLREFEGCGDILLREANHLLLQPAQAGLRGCGLAFEA